MNAMHHYPKVNYIGNKEKISEWIGSLIPDDATTFFDAFAGGSSIGYTAKAKGLTVFSNDIMTVNYHIAKALVENNGERLTADDVELIFSGEPTEGYMFAHYADVFYFADECRQLDQYRRNIDLLPSAGKRSLALALMRRAMVRKMPYSRFTIKWEKIKQLRDEEYSYRMYRRKRAYHNQSFRFHFEDNLAAYNEAIFDNGKPNRAYRLDIFEAVKHVEADVIYLDPPYAGTMCDYYSFYHVLDEYIEGQVSSPFPNSFTDRRTIESDFERLFASLSHYRYWLLSYNSRSLPPKETLLGMLRQHAVEVELHEMPYAYRVTGKEKKQQDVEYLFVVKNNRHD